MKSAVRNMQQKYPRAVKEGPAYREETVNTVHVIMRELQIIYVSVR